MLRVVLSIVLGLLATSPAAAGPWPREAGQGFLAFTFAPPGQGGQRPERLQIYGEYGLRARLTFAASIERHGSGTRQEVALRWHPPDLPGGLVWGLSAGLHRATAAGVGARAEHRALLGASTGRGHDTRFGNIWLRTDATAFIGPAQLGGLDYEMKLATQIGLRREGWLGMVAITHDHNRVGSHTRLRPALGYDIGRRLTLVGEATLTTGGRREALALSLWSRF